MIHLPQILLIDCFDSFTYNLVHYLEPFSKVDVQRVNKIKPIDIKKYDAIVLSPGPGLPSDYPILKEIIKKANVPMLGVCLGLQAIVESFGGSLKNLPEVWHGIARKTFLDTSEALFSNIPNEILTGRYHSWVADFVPNCLKVTATDIDGYVMAVSHTTKPIKAVQFHPESVLTEHGKTMIENWINEIKRLKHSQL